jgi:hypothetical protein
MQRLHPRRRGAPTAKRPRHANKDYDALIRAAWDAGWWCERRGTNHIACHPHEGAFVMVPSTPSGSRTLANVRAKLRRAGLAV